MEEMFMDFKRGLTFLVQDPQWLAKIAVGTLISLVPILNFAAVGYSLDVLRNVYHGRETPLPEWNNLGEKFVRGLLGVVIQFLWSLPILLLACPFYIIALASIAGSSNGDEIGVIGGLAMFCAIALALVGSLVLAPFIMAAYARYAVTNNLSEAMPGPVLREVRGNVRPWLLTIGVVIAFGIFIAVVAACTFGLGGLLVLPLNFYMQLVIMHWYAQAHRESVGGPASPPSMV
jgi:hypothetical protein